MLIVGHVFAAEDPNPDIYSAGEGLLEIVDADNPVQVIRLTMNPGQALPDHRSGPRIIITESELNILRLEDERAGIFDTITAVSANQAFWLENTVSKGFRHVGDETATYLAILWPVHSEPKKTFGFSACPSTQLLDNEYAIVCLIETFNAEHTAAQAPKGHNWIIISHSRNPTQHYLIQIKQV